MALLVPTQGENVLLGRMLSATDTAFLFTDIISIDDSTTLSNLHIVSGTGAPGAFTLSDGWTISNGTATYNGSDSGAVDFAFTNAGGGPWSVYGYAIMDSTATYLLWAENFTNGPFIIPTDGGTISIVFKISLE